jgi:anti-sigma regulatory factor (Ser/Thr protein kinase)
MIGSVFVILCAGFTAEYVDRLHERVKYYLTVCGIYGTPGYVLVTVVDELVCNILEHSQASWVELEMHPEEGRVKLLLRDNGGEFDPLPAITAKGPESLDEIHGERSLGLYMVGQLATSWQYRRVDSKINELDFIIDLSKQENAGGEHGAH